MFVHNFKYSLKILFKNKGLLFWTFIFPIILGTLFNLAFSNIEKTETFNKIDVAITPNNNSYIISAFKVLQKENVEPFFIIVPFKEEQVIATLFCLAESLV